MSWAGPISLAAGVAYGLALPVRVPDNDPAFSWGAVVLTLGADSPTGGGSAAVQDVPVRALPRSRICIRRGMKRAGYENGNIETSEMQVVEMLQRKIGGTMRGASARYATSSKLCCRMRSLASFYANV